MFNFLHSSFIIHHSSLAFLAAPTQEEVFRSIQSSVESSGDGATKFLAVLLGVSAVVIVLALLSKRQAREAAPRALNHPGKLMRELVRAGSLTALEVKKIKTVADDLASKGRPLESPLTVVLCPSVLTRRPLTQQNIERPVSPGVTR